MIATDIKTKIPEGWTQEKLGNLFDIIAGQAPHSIYYNDKGLGFPFLKVNSFGVKFPEVDTWTTKSLRDSKEGDVLFSVAGSIGFVNYGINASITRSIFALRPKNNKISQEYLYYLMNYISPTLSNFAGGSAQKVIGKVPINKFEFPIPNLLEQQKITEVLTTIDEAIEKTDAIIEKNKRIKQGLMQDLFRYGIDEHGNIRSEKTHKFKTVKIGNEEMLIPEEWEVATIPDILKKQKNAMKIGPFGSQLKIEYLVNSGYKVYGQENAFNKDFSIGKRYINKKRFNLLKTCELLSGDFIISMMGTIGQCAIIPNNIERGIMDSHLIRLQINEQKFNKDLLWLLIEEYPLIKQQIINLSVGGIMQGLSTKIIRQLMLMLPDIKEQDNITNLLLKISKVIRGEEVNKQKLLSLKRGLMEDLLTGTVRVNSLITN